MTTKATSGGGFFRFFYGKEHRIEDFCSNLTKGIPDTDTLLQLRKRAFHFADWSTLLNKTDRDLFTNILIKNIDNHINKNLDNYIKQNYTTSSIMNNPEQIKKTYEEMLAYIMSVKAEMRPVARQLTLEEEEKESIDFLAKTLGNILATNDFNPKVMPEMQALPELVRLRFIQYSNEILDNKIDAISEKPRYSYDGGWSDYHNARNPEIKKLQAIKANIR
jgi:hypothetical protein